MIKKHFFSKTFSVINLFGLISFFILLKWIVFGKYNGIKRIQLKYYQSSESLAFVLKCCDWFEV
jgi:hypothetical protein